MTVTRVLVIFAIGWVGKNAAFAQPGTFGPICAGVQSIGWCHQFSPALPSAMAVGADGTTYVATAQRVDGGFVTAVSPNGAVIYETTFKRSVNALAPGRNGTLWVIAESLFQVDSQGHATAISSPYNTANTYYACSDAAGNLYVAAFVQPDGNSIAKLNPAGTLVGMFPIAAYGSPTAMSVDSLGAVYVVGVPASTFEPTAGAFQTTWPKSVYSMSKGYALKIAPTLDHVVYATLLYQGQSYGATSPTAIAVDGAGNAYIGGTFDQSPDQLFPAREIGCP